MNKLILASLFALGLFVNGYSEPLPSGQIGFGGGLNLQSDITNIKDEQSPDMCNCIANLDGSMGKRGGSERYIDQAVSSQPFTALYRAYASTGTTDVKRLIGIVGDKIVYSTGDTNPVWIQASSNTIRAGQSWDFTTMSNHVIFTGDGLVDPIYKFNLFTSSLSTLTDNDVSTEGVTLRAKYVEQKSNYLLLINVAEITDGTTFYPSRIYYSLLNSPRDASVTTNLPISSFSWNRYIDVKTNDGEELTGAGVLNDEVTLFKPSSIHSLSYSVLSPGTGDQALRELTNGFGLKAPRSLQNIGNYYIMAAQDAIRLYDGGRRSRLTVGEENRTISDDIKPLIDKLIKAGTYQNIIGKYYKKKEYYLMAYEHPERFPKGRPNSVMIYDIRKGQWFPVCGWLVNSWETFDGKGDNGQLVYGDLGIVHKADLEEQIDDSGKFFVIDTMDSLASWNGVRVNRDTTNIIEGTASLRMWIAPSVLESSMSLNRMMILGEWYDRTKITKDDKIQFKIYTTSIGNITSLRVDLEVDDVTSFDTNFTSVTLSSASLNAANTTWTTVEIALSSFPTRPDWTDFDSEEIPFANTLSYYGLRFVLNGINISSMSIDDVRIVQAHDRNPVNFYRYTKLFDFSRPEIKKFGQILLTYEKSPDAILSMDVYNDFGRQITTEKFEREIPRELVVLGLVSTASIAIVDDVDYSIIQSTIFAESSYLPLNAVANKDFIFFPDRTNNRYVKMDRAPFGVILTTFGSIGSGTTNFNIAHQSDIDEKNNIYIIDIDNQRVKVHKQSDLSFVKAVGGLSRANTGYHQPTGITCDESNCYVADEGNYRWLKLSISTLGATLVKDVDYNTIGDTSLDQDDSYVYGAYNKTSEDSINHQDVVLEKRNKGDLELVNRVRITPKDSVALSTYALQGDIALRGRYIFVSFTDNALANNPTYYIQKRLKSDFSIVNEFVSTTELFSVIGDPFAHKPMIKSQKKDLKVEGQYLQIRFYDTGLDNYLRLVNQTYLMNLETLKY